MKSKKNAFANSSTGYGRHKHSFINRNSGSNSSSSSSRAERDPTAKDGGKSNGNPFEENADKKIEKDKDLNSGFGDYLRTPEAFEMMKLFIFANTIMLIVTMAWPNIREQYYWLHQWWETFQYERSQ